jgi:hypothetical protein
VLTDLFAGVVRLVRIVVRLVRIVVRLVRLVRIVVRLVRIVVRLVRIVVRLAHWGCSLGLFDRNVRGYSLGLSESFTGLLGLSMGLSVLIGSLRALLDLFHLGREGC